MTGSGRDRSAGASFGTTSSVPGLRDLSLQRSNTANDSKLSNHGMMRRRLCAQWDLLWELTLRDLRIRYKRSILGIGWSLLTPFAQILIFSFLFIHVMPLGVENYTSFVFCGVLAWSWFSASVVGAAGAVVYNPELVRRPGFPTGILPVLTVVSNGVHFLIALPLLVALAAVNGITMGPSLLAVPLVIAVQFLFTCALAFPIASLNVRYRDTGHFVSLVAMAAFYLTPVFYNIQQVPEAARVFYLLNPMVTVIESYRDIFLRGEWPNFLALAIVALVSALLLLPGYVGFGRASAAFAEEL